MVNDANFSEDFKKMIYCLRCRKETEHAVNRVAIWTTETCTICGKYDTEQD